MIKTEEILVDEGFIDWALNQPSKNADQWKQWMVEHPELQSEVEEALKLFKNMKLTEIIVSDDVIEAEKNKLLKALDSTSQPAKLFRLGKLKWVASVAACFLLLAVGAYLFNVAFGKQEEKTAYGEIKEKQLPDGTSVLLNSNSSISYASSWEKSKEREVWIKGEAFFHVTKMPNHKRFVVHTDKFDVIVTGTKFNVLNRKNKATILLEEGGVTVHFLTGKDLILLPGESVEYDDEQINVNNIKPEKAKEEKVLAWVNKRLYFENTSISDVCDKINELYGVDMELGADSIQIRKRTITGILPNDSLDILLKSLEATTDFKLERKDNKVIVNLP
jgi:ferric-dicitrate binding protein FerR (iron transport regulator)